ncbi:MAG: transposase zinc-binding domain-containing protein, partial [Alphaproteobacteria bacterium]|nr:transposase zinc-binding domain-containing protein [Alphaproteobacteria bacterium]
MARYELELADVVRRFQGPYEAQFGALMLPSHRRALHDIADCMTEAMGGGRYHCNDCDDDFWSYHGCRNRSCPKCHGRQTADWLKARTAELLPCDYFHVTATVPSELRPLCRRHQK